MIQRLTPRERTILAHISNGDTNDEIADRLGISHHTVRTHVSTILTRTGARTRAHAVALALRSQQID